MTFAISQACVDLGLRAETVVFRGVRIGPRSPELQEEILREAEQVQSKFAGVPVRQSRDVQAFQAILRKAGASPKEFKPSLERLWAYALKRGDLPSINNLVDAYNLVSIRRGCSLGAHDVDKIALPVSLRLLTGTETFTPLGGAGLWPVAEGEFGYVDAANRLLCRYDVLQADFSKVTADTTNVFLIVEATDQHPAELLRQTMAEVLETVTRYCGGVAETIDKLRS